MNKLIKILLLAFLSVTIIAGILMFAKTRVSPPTNIEFTNQYTEYLKQEAEAFDILKDFKECEVAYVRMDDLLKRLLIENAIEPQLSDEFRKRIDKKYGKILTSYSFGLLQKSVWSEEKLNEMLITLSSLNSDKLSTGERAVPEDFTASLHKIKGIVTEYRKALRFSQDTSFKGIDDAASRIKKAESLRSAKFLKNNNALICSLKALPNRIAQSHFNYVCNTVDALDSYFDVPEDHYINTLIPRADNAITEFKNTGIYGNNKPDITMLENHAIGCVMRAMKYYGH